MVYGDGDGEHTHEAVSSRGGHALGASVDDPTSSGGPLAQVDAMQMTPPPPGLMKHGEMEPMALAGMTPSQPFVTQASQTVPAFGRGGAHDSTRSSGGRRADGSGGRGVMGSGEIGSGGIGSGGGATTPRMSHEGDTNPSSKKRKAQAVPDWVHYDADIVDNMSKTRRFTSDCISEDLVSRMSMSEDGNEAGTRLPTSSGLSPSPLSRAEKLMGPCAGSLSTPTLPKRDIQSGASAGIPAKLFEAELTVTTSPSDVIKMDGGGELRKTALVRLALRNGRQAYEMDTSYRN